MLIVFKFLFFVLGLKPRLFDYIRVPLFVYHVALDLSRRNPYLFAWLVKSLLVSIRFLKGGLVLVIVRTSGAMIIS